MTKVAPVTVLEVMEVVGMNPMVFVASTIPVAVVLVALLGPVPLAGRVAMVDPVDVVATAHLVVAFADLEILMCTVVLVCLEATMAHAGLSLHMVPKIHVVLGAHADVMALQAWGHIVANMDLEAQVALKGQVEQAAQEVLQKPQHWSPALVLVQLPVRQTARPRCCYKINRKSTQW